MPLSPLARLLPATALATLGGIVVPTRPAAAQATPADSSTGTPLSLADAVRAAEQSSPVLRIARDAVTRAEGEQYEARSGLFPQLSGSANYTRTFQSQFQALAGGGSSDTSTVAAPPTPCNQYILDANAPVDARLAGLEQYAHCSAATGGFGGIDFSQVGFGSPNAYTLGLSVSQNLFTGGRLLGQIHTAEAAHRSAEIEMTAQRAQLILDVTQAYYQAALSNRLLQIAQASLQQAEDQLQQVQLQQRVGNASEFDLLRATVSRDNLRPAVIQRQSERQIAYLRLEQLLHLPLDRPLHLTTSIEDTTATPPGVPLARAAAPDTVTDRRAPVREASENVAAQAGQLQVARSAWFPSVSLSSAYSRVAYPSGGIPAWGSFYPNWTLTLGVSYPLFTGGRRHGDVLVAEAGLNDARARLQQARDAAALDTRDAVNTLTQARAALAASQGTTQQAQRAFDIAQVRYREGISTQLELNDARNQLAQALTNRAQAARDVLVARVRLALLPDLPLQTQGAGQVNLSPQQQQTPQPVQPSQTSPSSSAAASPVPAAGSGAAAGATTGGSY